MAAAGLPRRGSLLQREKPCHRVPAKNTTEGIAKVNATAHQPPQIVRANGIDLCYEIFGDADAEPMLLIMGLGAQMIHWEDDFCRQLAGRGFRVIRFDNRDIGKSSHLSGGKPHYPCRVSQAAVPENSGRSPLQAARHGGGHRRADGRARHQVGACGRPFDGRHDRPGNRDLASAPGALADLDHVDDGQPQDTPADPRGLRRADGAAADHAGRIFCPLRADLEGAARRQFSRKTRRSTAPAPNARSSAASTRPASAGSSAPSSPPAAARSGCTRSRRPPSSFTAPSIPWCTRPAARTPRPRYQARNC